MRTTPLTLLVLNMEEGHTLKNVDGLQKLEKAKSQTVPKSFQKGKQPCPHFDFSPVKSVLDVWPLEM